MSPKDIRHYKFLRRAIELKYRFPDQPAFETFSYDPYIFRWASNTFYELKLFDYLDIRERAVLVRLYENLKKDPRLKFLDDPDSLKDKNEFKLPESFHAKIASEQAKLSAQAGQATPVGGAAAQSARPVSGKGPTFRPPSLPSTPSVSSTRGKLPRVSFGTGNFLRNLGSQSSIFLKKNVFNRVFTPTRLVTGFTTILGGIVGSGLGPIGTLAGAGAGFLAPSYVKTFGTRHLTRAAHWGADSMVRLSSQTSRFSVGGFGGRSVMGKRVAIAAILLFFGVGALAAFAPLPGQETPPAAATSISPGFINTLAPPNPACPKLHDEILDKFKVDFDQKNPFSCDYLQWAWEKLWNVSNTKFLELVRGSDKNKIITVKREDKGFNEQTGCPSIIMSGMSSVDQKPYPKSLFQVVFIHELSHVIQSCNPGTVNFTTLTTALNQEGGLTTFSQDPTKCISGVTRLNEDFAETLAYYLNPEWGEQSYFSTCQPKDSLNPFSRGDKPLHQQFAANLLGTAAVSLTTPKISCPVVGGGPNILASYQADPINGHCGEKYANKIGACTDGVNSRRAKSIDIESCLTPRPACTIDTCKPLTADEQAVYSCGQSGKNIELPSILGQTNLKWERLNDIPLSQGDCFDYEILDPNGSGGGCGVGYVFKADLGGGKNWVLHLLHMGPTALEIGQSYPAGTIVGKAQAVHVHISIGQDIQNATSQLETGWKSVDSELNLCK